MWANYIEQVTDSDGKRRIRIKPDRLPDVAHLIIDHDRQSWFVDYANELDWISMYGDPDRRASIPDALEYYEKRHEVAKASEALLAGTRRGVIKPSMQPDVYASCRLREKLLEAYLEHNLATLENGLRFKGKQGSTPTGPLDILALDSNHWWVVIELKRERASDKVVAQLQRYVGYVRWQYASGQRTVRGMIIAGKVESGLRAAIRGNVTFPVNLYEHDAQFRANIRPVSLNSH